jgi:sugar lactone lactonase YvrE
VIDSTQHSVLVFDFDLDTGQLVASGRDLDLSAYSGEPDGLTIDTDGNLWIAFWGGSAVRCFAPSAALIRDWPVPVSQPTTVALTPAGMFLTSARHGLRQPEPLAGALLRYDCDVRALPRNPFG